MLLVTGVAVTVVFLLGWCAQCGLSNFAKSTLPEHNTTTEYTTFANNAGKTKSMLGSSQLILDNTRNGANQTATTMNAAAFRNFHNDQVQNQKWWYARTPSIPSSVIFRYRHISTYLDVTEDYSCAGSCGKSLTSKCSCRPSCVVLTTCCVDFNERCVHTVYSPREIERNFSQFRDLDKKCSQGSMLIASCPKDNNTSSKHGNQSQTNTTVQNLYNQLASSSSPIDLMRLLVLVSWSYSTNVSTSTDLEWLLTTIAIQDVSTGISYSNISIFQCNGAQWSSAKPFDLNVYYDYTSSGLLLGRRLPSFKSLSTHMDIRQSRNVDYSFSSPCINDLISTCPTDFPDDYVKSACENTAFFIKTKNKFGDPASEKALKNPFCKLCNDGLDPLDIVRGMTLNQAESRIQYRSARFIILDTGLTLKSTPFVVHGDPAWKEISYTLADAKNGAPDINFTSENFSQDVFDMIKNKDFTLAVKTCVVRDLLQPGGDCSVSLFIALLLPPGAKSLGTHELVLIFRDFIDRFSSIMAEWDIRFLHDSIKYHQDLFEFDSRTIQYAITSETRVGAFFIVPDKHTLRFKDLPRILWSGSDFPFHNESQYFCLIFSRFEIYIFEHYLSHVCLDFSEESGALVYTEMMYEDAISTQAQVSSVSRMSGGSSFARVLLMLAVGSFI